MKKFAIFLFSLLILSVFGCALDDGEESTIQQLEEEASEALGTEVYIPEHENYPITMAQLEYDVDFTTDGDTELDEAIGISIGYSTGIHDEEEPMDKEEKEEWEERNQTTVLYHNPPQGETVMNISFSKRGIASGGQEIDLDGHEVNQQYLEREDHDIVSLQFDHGEGAYTIHYHLVDGNTEDDALAFVASMLNEME